VAVVEVTELVVVTLLVGEVVGVVGHASLRPGQHRCLVA
jgi:hypothetical protein